MINIRWQKWQFDLNPTTGLLTGSHLLFACAWQVDECHMFTFKGFLSHKMSVPVFFQSSRMSEKIVDLSAITVISSPVALMVQLYWGTSAASISLNESSSLSAMLRGAGRGPSLALAPRISRNQVLMAPSSSRVPGTVVCSEKGKVMNLAMWRRGV